MPQQVIVNSPFLVTMRITNPIRQPSTRIYIEIGEEFLEGALPGMPTPPPQRITHTDNRLLLEYPPLPPGANMLLQLPFIQQRAGITTFVTRVYAPSNHLRKEVRESILAQTAPPLTGKGGILP